MVLQLCSKQSVSLMTPHTQKNVVYTCDNPVPVFISMFDVMFSLSFNCGHFAYACSTFNSMHVPVIFFRHVCVHNLSYLDCYF